MRTGLLSNPETREEDMKKKEKRQASRVQARHEHKMSTLLLAFRQPEPGRGCGANVASRKLAVDVVDQAAPSQEPPSPPRHKS